ncbi:DUF305 domain-containing protein [Jiangella aurantiaca]|uniref:DUF305 domain-containing protein n=1 Tax=Jiangella aurantiaca TaxID=2530373 RepID=A0A4R5AET5_9ACTN|nr:DUF305 domain-containing protein [Jiangella aurantiaca]TDD69840.1 DUF305 domain-containing protein [Jiangella aurantiaca]
MYRTRFTLPALVAAVGLLLAGCGDDESNDAGADPATETSATEAEFNDADVDFAQGMIPHHEQAVEMAQVVPDQGVSPELIELADAIEAAQQPEIDQMTAMLERWSEDAPSDDPHAGHGSGDMDMDMDMEGMMSAGDMEALGAAAGAEFEQMFLTMMIEHHEGAIAMAETELAEGQDPEAQELAQTIIDAQQAEITQMEQMLQGVGS